MSFTEKELADARKFYTQRALDMRAMPTIQEAFGGIDQELNPLPTPTEQPRNTLAKFLFKRWG